MDKNLKDYRDKELKYYVIGNALIIMLLTGSLKSIYTVIDSSSSNTLLEICKELLSASIISSVLYVYVFLLDAIIPGEYKDKICMLGRKLPGETIFEDIVNEGIKDIRFTKQEVEKRYRDIYAKLNDQCCDTYQVSNSLWYKIYKSWEFEPVIFISNRDYLLCRDLCVSTLWVGIIYIVLVSFSVISFSWEVIIALIAELILTNIAMRGKQKRFAVNVIATDIKKEKEKPTDE